MPLQEKYYCYLLKPKADHQRSKKPLRVFSWIGPYVREKVPPKNDLVRKINTNETQILNFIKIRQFAIDTPLEDSYIDEEKRPDDEIVIPKVDLWSITLEAGSNPFVLDYTKKYSYSLAVKNPDTTDSVVQPTVDENFSRTLSDGSDSNGATKSTL